MTFTSFKNARIVRSGWLDEGGRRLDCNPYMSGALEARDTLKQLKVRKDALSTLTAGHAGGIYNGPMFKRNYVEATEYGVPFISSGSMLLADLSNLPLLSKKDAESSRLSYLRLQYGMTLISCSGTVGRMAYVRPDMDGIWSSQDVLKVVPDPQKISPGYLHAFLSSRFGVPLVVSGTYGAIIQHIEAEHISELPVPRLGDVENLAESLMADSAFCLSKYDELLRQARSMVLSEVGLIDPSRLEWFSSSERLGWLESGVTSESLRAYNYDPRVKKYLKHLSSICNESLGSLCDPTSFKGHIVFKRIESDPEHGYQLLGQREAFQRSPEGRWISRRSVEGLGLVVPPGTVLIPSHGTLGEFELYCRAAIVTERTSRYAYSGDFYRCIPIENKIRSGYLYAFLSTKVGFRILRSMSTGGKQQYQHPSLIARLPIPRLGEFKESQIADLVDQATAFYDRGLALEDQARSIVENAIVSMVN